MCLKCEGFSETISFDHPYEYFDLIIQVKELMKQGTMVLVKGNCKLEEIQKDKPFSDDVNYHVFKCISCGRTFELGVETYHGSGGCWKVLEY